MKLIILFFITYCTASDVVERERISVRSLHKRDLSENEKEIHLTAFGNNYRLLMKRSEVLSPNFTFVIASLSPTGESILEMKQIESDQPIQIYSQTEGPASLAIDESDNLQVEGILEEGLRIYPAQEEGEETDHIVERQTLKRDLLHDYILMDESFYDGMTSGAQETSRNTRQLAQSATVEVLPVLDYPNCQKLEQDSNKIARYLGISWNFVNQCYSKARNPAINLILIGVVTFQKLEDQTFINPNVYSEDKVDDSVLDDFKDWLIKNDNSLPSYDTAMLQISYDVGRLQNGKWSTALSGLAYVGTTCRTDGYASSFSEDKAPYYTGVRTMAHELAHSLNSPHDGEGQSSSCSPSDGYLMGSGSLNEFSPCSLTAIRNFASSKNADCLYENKNKPKYDLINEAPGLRTDSDLQCQGRFGDGYKARYLFDSDSCNKLWCGKAATSSLSVGPALEGTVCGYNQVCINGKCSANPVPTGLAQCRSYSPFYSSANENDSDFCRSLRCRSYLGYYDNRGAPMDGTVCGNAGRCIDKTCVGEVPSLNAQCKRLFGDATAKEQSPTSEVCSTLWCRVNDKTKAYGGAFESTICGDNQFCKDGVCRRR